MHNHPACWSGLLVEQRCILEPEYIQPEYNVFSFLQIAGSPLSAQSDVFSLATVLWEFLSQTVPFSDLNDAMKQDMPLMRNCLNTRSLLLTSLTPVHTCRQRLRHLLTEIDFKRCQAGGIFLEDHPARARMLVRG